MPSFPTEPELIAALDRADLLVRCCASGDMSFAEFCSAYDNFYWSFPLDGHESDPAGLAVLAKHSTCITPHRLIAEHILSKVASSEGLRADGRLSYGEAVARLKLVAAGLPVREA